MSLRGQTYVVTGATSGIGQAMAAELSRRGARVAIVGRNQAKLGASAAAIGGDVDVFLADLSLVSEVKRLARELNDSYDHIDVLINNAGIHSFTSATTSEGYDEMVATNHFAPFVLTNLVLDTLQAAPAPRVVVTSSEAHRLAGRIDLDRLAQPGEYAAFSSFRAYGNTKLLNVLFAQELARRTEGTGLTANSMCPGTVNTGLFTGHQPFSAIVGALSHSPVVRTPEQGARMGMKLATDPALANVSGEFLTATPGLRFLPRVPARRDAELQRRLWERTAELTGL